MFEGTIAFVTVPLCVGADSDALTSYARTLRTQVLRLAAQQPSAWVIDLRFNGGGNIWPMLLGFQPLLGDGVLTTSVIDGVIVSRAGLQADAAWLERGGTRSVQLSIEPATHSLASRGDASTPIAVLIGPWTMSSGELLALAFRGRARFFGAPTAGLTTGNDHFFLSDGSVLNLPIDHMADRTGWAPRGRITPDQAVEGGDWPTESDAQASAAKAWGLAASGAR